ncbi:AzlD domain-containing protein [Anaerorhabdus sp.]|jgi:branched-subunit amino acid transport protein|uniref:AzlD domain-containing protein n=1 Tax=Anaerorhabdus sp. TaxID=1872524 RepID=UPI002FC6221F
MNNFLLYLLVTAGTTYLLRVIPLIFIKGKIKNKWISSFLFYMPYAVLSAMTFPAIINSTASPISAIAGLITALVLAYKEKGLLTVALYACAVVFIVERFI